MNTSLDIEFVRSQFPAFNAPSLQGQAFFDAAGGSYMCGEVIDHLNRFYRESKVQPGGAHPVSRVGNELMELSHVRLAEYLGVVREEVHLGPSTSQNTVVLAHALLNTLAPGDEVIVTNQDHEANNGVWRRLEKFGVVIKEWQVDPVDGSLDPKTLDSLLSSRTKVVCFTHCSNIIGQINKVGEICEKVHAAAAIAIVDGVSYTSHGLPDVAALGADIYLFSLYKTFGPHQGVMVIRRPVMQLLGNQGHFFNNDSVLKWFVPGGPDHAQVAAARGVPEYFDRLHAHHFGEGSTANRPAEVRALLRSAEMEFLPRVLDFCHTDKRVRLLGPVSAADRAATISVHTKTAAPKDISARLAERGIIAGAGHFYAARVLSAMGLDPATGVLRLSFVHYNNEQEINQLLDALDQVL